MPTVLLLQRYCRGKSYACPDVLRSSSVLLEQVPDTSPPTLRATPSMVIIPACLSCER